MSNKKNTTTLLNNRIIPKNINAKKVSLKSFYCHSCGEEYLKLDTNFPASYSELYAAYNYHLPICRKCLDSIYSHYITVYDGKEIEAIRRVCMLFDIYFSNEIVESSKKIRKYQSRIHAYISKTNLIQYRNKTYDSTIEEEKKDVIESIDDAKESRVLQKSIKFFGTGFKDTEYIYLQEQYQEWTTRHECNTKTQEELFKAICFAQLNILKAQQTGEKVAEAMKAFQDLLGSANLKPTQTNDNALADQNTFGTLIKKWEDHKPIPEPDPQWEDVDGIVKYITAYFHGHLCKMMGIKNSHSRIYDEEMSKYKVQKPEYEDDDEALFDAIFGGGKNVNEEE